MNRETERDWKGKVRAGVDKDKVRTGFYVWWILIAFYRLHHHRILCVYKSWHFTYSSNMVTSSLHDVHKIICHLRSTWHQWILCIANTWFVHSQSQFKRIRTNERTNGRTNGISVGHLFSICIYCNWTIVRIGVSIKHVPSEIFLSNNSYRFEFDDDLLTDSDRFACIHILIQRTHSKFLENCIQINMQNIILMMIFFFSSFFLLNRQIVSGM